MPLVSRVSLLLLASSLCLSGAAISPVRSSASALCGPQSSAETEARALVEKYFSLYAAKDLDGLMGLWSQRSPDYASLKQSLQRQFATEDCRFSLPAISRVKVEGEKVSLRAAVSLTASDLKNKQPRERPIVRNLALVREEGKWKVWRFVPAENDLAEALAQAETEKERAGLLAEEKELATSELVEALNAQGHRFNNQGNHQQALAIFHLARGIGEQIGARTALGNALIGIGIVHYAQGDYANALEFFQKSLEILEAESNKAGIARVLNNIGRIHDAQGDYANALELYQKSLAIHEASGNKEGIAIGLGNIGVIYSRQGNLARALEYYQKSLAMSEAADDKLGVAITLGNIGAVHRKQGDYAQALDHYQKSLAISEAIGDQVGIAQMANNIGNTHFHQGDYAQALEYFQKSLAINEGLGANRGIANALQAIGKVQASQGDHEQALENYQKSLAMNEAMGNKDGVAIALSNIGDIHQKQGRYSQALDFAERASALARQIGGYEALWGARVNAGLAYRALNQSDHARQAFEEAIAIIETVRVQVAGREQEQQRLFEDKLSPYLAMVDLLIAQNNPTEALTFAERAKARALLDVLQTGRVNVAKAMTASEQEQERQLNGQLVALNTQISREAARPQPDQARLSELKARLHKARLDFEAFQTNVYAAHPELRAQRGEAQPLKLEEASTLLPDAASALLEYVVTDEVTYLLVVTKAQGKSGVEAQVFTVPVKQAELAKLTESFRGRLAERDLGFRASAHQLYDLLLKPAQALLRGKTSLVIVPDDRLWELPFQALLAEGDHYVIENSAVSYAPSLTALREMQARRDRRSAGAATSSLLAFGDPVIGQTTIERAALTQRSARLAPLPEADEEVRALGQLYGAARSKVYIGAEAREDRVKAEAARARILHFATHGTLNNASPMYSYLALAQGDKNEDGLLEAWELMQMDLHADLAVLSACETARGRYGAGEGVIGLTWALFVAGVPSTVVSQWKVESASTRDLMLNFHRQLLAPAAKTKVTKAEALRQAALKVMKNLGTSHPFYWAGFVLVGYGGSDTTPRP
jgi:CHAT domain-containing protein/Tfp pilus assembly protein PilF